MIKNMGLTGRKYVSRVALSKAYSRDAAVRFSDIEIFLKPFYVRSNIN